MANDTEARKNKNVNLRVPEESEKVLVKNRVSSTNGIEEHRFEITVHQ